MPRIKRIRQYTFQLLLANRQLQVSRVGPSASTAPFVAFVAFVLSSRGAMRRVGRVHARDESRSPLVPDMSRVMSFGVR